MSRGASPTTRARTALRRRQVLELKVAGATFEEIAHELGVAPSRARGIFSEALRAAPHPLANEMRDVHNLRIDRLIRSMYVTAIGLPDREVGGSVLPAIPGDPKAVSEIRKLMERQARLNGLDAPVRVEGRFEIIDEDSVDDEIRRLSEELARNDHRDEEGAAVGSGLRVEDPGSPEDQRT